jgi:hypothetical protein
MLISITLLKLLTNFIFNLRTKILRNTLKRPRKPFKKRKSRERNKMNKKNLMNKIKQQKRKGVS